MPQSGRIEVKAGGNASTFPREKLPLIGQEFRDLLRCLPVLDSACTACESRPQCEACQRRCPLFHQPHSPEQDSAGLSHLLVNAIALILNTAGPASLQAHRSGGSVDGASRQKNASEAIPEGDLLDKPRNDLLAITEVIKRTKLSLRKIRYDMAAGALPYCKFGRSTRFDPLDVDAYIAGRRIGRRANSTKPR